MDISIAAICLENGSVAQRWGVRPGRRPGPADSLEPLHPAAAVHGQRFDKKRRPNEFLCATVFLHASDLWVRLGDVQDCGGAVGRRVVSGCLQIREGAVHQAADQ